MVTGIGQPAIALFDYPVFNLVGKSEQDRLDPKVVVKDEESPLKTIFQLAVPFEDQTTIDITERDIYLQDTFASLIEEREGLGLPYFLAVTKDSRGILQVVDATTFMRSYFKHDQKTSATTRQEVIAAQIYRIDSLKDQIFQYFCNLSQLRQFSGHCAKIINACDPHLDPAFRGQERYYLGSIFEKGLHLKNQTLVLKDLQKAFFWYQKSTEDHYFGGHIALASWYENGNEVVKHSEEELLKHLVEAINTLPPVEKRITNLCNMVASIYNARGEKELSDHYLNLAKAKLTPSSIEEKSVEQFNHAL